MMSSGTWGVMASRVIDKDKGWKNLKKTLKSFKDNELVVGIPGKIDFNVPTQAAIGAVQEFGSVDGKIESRSFLRSTFDRNVNKYNKELTENIKRAVKKGSPRKQGLFILGETVRKDVIDAIKNKEIRQDLAEATKQAFVPGTRTRRGEGVALVSTGTMVDQIVSVIRPRK